MTGWRQLSIVINYHLQDKAQVLADVRSIIADQLGTELEAVSLIMTLSNWNLEFS